MTRNELKKVIHYDSATGIFTWLISKRGRIPNAKAGGLWGKRYLGISVFGKKYFAHRLAFFYMKGIFPKYQIDHINGNPLDNRWCNLREATQFENCANSKIPKNNKSGVKGVSFNKASKKWVAYIGRENAIIHLGSFLKKDDAILARQKKQSLLHGRFSRIQP